MKIIMGKSLVEVIKLAGGADFKSLKRLPGGRYWMGVLL